MDELKIIRNEIDELDSTILRLIKKRMSLVTKIGELKKELDLPVVDPLREEIVLSRLIASAQKEGIDEGMVRQIWKSIFDSAYRLEK